MMLSLTLIAHWFSHAAAQNGNYRHQFQSSPQLNPSRKNRQILEAWLFVYYKSSTFNVCVHHQPLPMIEGPPLRLMINPDAKPTAHHKPIPVPLHWQHDVKEGLDQDCRLGVIEVVPVGEPTIWCHLMVTMTKKNGKLRRTVDLQPVNKYALRETHHTQSPFHQARAVPANKKKTVSDCWNGYPLPRKIVIWQPSSPHGGVINRL